MINNGDTLVITGVADYRASGKKFLINGYDVIGMII